jgi:hypothetical protein
MSTNLETILTQKKQAEQTGKPIYHVTVFEYAFLSPTNIREKIKPNKDGIYEPKDDQEIALLEFQVSKGLIGKTVPEAKK